MTDHGSVPAPRLIRQPEDGTAPVLELIRSARSSLRIKQFTFTEPELLDAVVAAHGAGLDVKVQLNPARSSGSRANDESFAALERAGVPVRWTDPRFKVTHEKSIVVDASRALIATFNLATKYFTQTRDYGVIVSDPCQVEEVARGFEADWEREPFAPHEHCGLLWSADNSRRLMAEFIDAATERLEVQHPKFVDATILERLVAASERGCKVHLLCGGKHGISDWDILDTFASLRILRTTGVKVRRQKHLKLHAKVLLVDERLALVGSMNIDRSAFDLRRELGVALDDADVVARLRAGFLEDWHAARHYDAPDPLDPSRHDEGELPHDPEFLHE